MPSLVPSVLGMMNAQTVAVDAHDEAMEKPSNTYGKHISMRKQGGTPQAVQPNSDLSYDPDVEAKIQKHIDHIDSEISNIQNEIGRVLNIEDKKGEEARPYSSDLGS